MSLRETGLARAQGSYWNQWPTATATPSSGEDTWLVLHQFKGLKKSSATSAQLAEQCSLSCLVKVSLEWTRLSEPPLECAWQTRSPRTPAYREILSETDSDTARCFAPVAQW